MPVTQDVIAINVGFSERRRTTSTGTKSRYTFEIDAEPILHNLSQEKLGDGPAHAIARAITAQIKNITEVVSLPTRQKRERAKQYATRARLEARSARCDSRQAHVRTAVPIGRRYVRSVMQYT